MDQPNGHPCPECGAPRHADNTPSCGCTRRAADALRDARTAEAAAAEDFDPLRIRPYVDLDGTTPDGLPEATKDAPPASGTPQAPTREGASADAPAEGLHPGPATPAGPGGTSAPEDHRTTETRAGNEAPGAPDATMTLKAVSPDAATSGRAPRGPAAAAPEAGGAAGTGDAPPADDAHTGSPAHAIPGAENRASAPGGPQVPANTTGSAAHDSAMASKAPRPDAGKPGTAAAAAPEADGPAGTGAAPGAGAPDGPRAQAGDAAPDATMTLRAVRPDAAAPGTAKPGAAGTPGPDDRTSALPTPLAPGTARPNVDDLGLFDDATRPLRAVSAGAAAPRPEAAAPRNRRRRGALIAASGAVVALLGAAGWASGLLSYDTPSRDTAAPDDVRASVPDASSAAPSETPSSKAPSASPSASASASGSPSASASGSPSPSASSSAPSASATAAPSATPSAAPSSAPAVAPEPEPEEPVDTAPVLRRGDGGPEVVELQQRLRQVWLYQGDLNGRYGHRVEEAVRHYQWSRGINEELGVYGPLTRSRLESETGGP
ncbi:peptidoglycan-binding protein [Streptomyces sp. DH20]|uniref:peptidoglycan-binding protein n=1 Tax=Streptomyces sp. DH20 TaxID=2857009 RepID=UPI001E2FEF76|nr:peptidoglycan-binding protein [Streptomyces sp. DH20]